MSESEKWILIATAVGTFITIIKTFVLPLIKKEKLMMTITTLETENMFDALRTLYPDKKLAKLLIAFNNNGDKPATFHNISFIYVAQGTYDKTNRGIRFPKEIEVKPRVITPGEIYYLNYSEEIDFQKLRKTNNLKREGNNPVTYEESVNVWMKIKFSKADGIMLSRSYKIARFAGNQGSLRNTNYQYKFTINLFKKENFKGYEN